MHDLTRSGAGPAHGRDGHSGQLTCEEGLEGAEVFQHVLTIRARMDEADAAAFIRRTLQEIHAHIKERGLEVTGPPFSLCHPLPEHRVDVEAGWPVASAQGTERIHAGALPASQLSRHG